MSGTFQCELCSEQAAVYCQADVAFLCLSCDAAVHSANLLVKRHVRMNLCSKCHAPTTKIASSLLSAGHISSVCHGCLLKKQEELPLNSSGATKASQYSAHILTAFPKVQSQFTKDAASNQQASYKCASKRYRKEGGRSISNAYQFDGMSNLESASSSTSQLQDRKRKKTDKRHVRLQDTSHSSCKAIQKNLDSPLTQQTLLEAAAEAKVEAILSKWHTHLGMEERQTIYVAMHLLSAKKTVTRVTLAVCLYLAAKLCEQSKSIPSLLAIEKFIGVPHSLLQTSEVHFCTILGWNTLMHEECSESTST